MYQNLPKYFSRHFYKNAGRLPCFAGGGTSYIKLELTRDRLRSFVCSFVSLFVRSFVRSFVRLFVRSFVTFRSYAISSHFLAAIFASCPL